MIGNPFNNPENIFTLFFILAGVLTVPFCFFALSRYKNAVFKYMQLTPPGNQERIRRKTYRSEELVQWSASKFSIIGPHDPIPLDSPASVLYTRLKNKPVHAVLYLAIAGFVFAGIATLVYFPGKQDPNDAFNNVLVIGLVMCWPVIISALITATPSKKQQLLILGIYLVPVLFFAIVDYKFFFTPWFYNSFIPTLLAWVILNRKFRAVGPIVFLSLLVFFFVGAIFFWLLSIVSDKTASSSDIPALLFIAPSFALAGWFAFKIPGIFSWLYTKQKTNDYMLATDVLWLIFTYALCLSFAFPEVDSAPSLVLILMGILPFIAYKILAMLGEMLLRNDSLAHKGYNLLLLRVFDHHKRSQKFLHQLSLHWRHTGPIQLLTAQDLAAATIEPHEFFSYLNGKMAMQFINKSRDLERSLNNMFTKVDKDGRYRINEFACSEFIWKDALDILIKVNDCVLMDIRGFSERHQGCVYEVQQLVRLASLNKVTFLVDKTTDIRFLNQIISDAYSAHRLSFANEITLYNVSGETDQDLPAILKILAQKAVAENVHEWD